MTTIQLEFPEPAMELLKSIDEKLTRLVGEKSEETMYSIKEAAVKLGISPGTVRKLAKAGEIESINKGTGKNEFLMFTEKALSDFRERRTKEGVNR